MLRNKFWSLDVAGLPIKYLIYPMIWLVVISIAHYQLNFESSDRTVIKMGYMPVITNFAAPILDYASRDGEGVRYQANKYSSFAEMAESLRNKQIDVAFMIAPLSIVLRQQGADVKVVMIGNRHESTLVTRKDLHIADLRQLEGKTVAVPMRFSGHNLSILKLLREYGLEGKVNVVEMNPPDMASALASGSLDAYYVGEPFAAKTLKSGDADLLFYVEQVWPGFLCNLVIVNQSLIDESPDLVEHFVESAARAGVWVQHHPKEAAKIAAKYWNSDPALVEYAMTTPKNRIVYNKFVPKEDEMQYLADLMVEFKLLKSNDISGLVDDRYARSADLSSVTDIESILTH